MGLLDTFKNTLGGAGKFLGDTAQNIGDTYNYLTNFGGKGYQGPTLYPNGKPQPSGGATQVPDYAGAASADYAALLKQIQSLSRPAPTPVAPYFDIAANFSRARSQAEGAVNPLYTKKLNDFITQQTVEKTRKQQDTQLANENLDQALKDTLEANTTARERTAEDTTQNIGQINTQEQNFQSDQGSAFDQLRQTLAGGLATSGLQGSGLGNKAAASATTSRNVQEGRATESFHVQKQAQETAKNRNFEDLFRSDTTANRNTTQSKSNIKINLDRFIEDQGTQLDSTKNDLEAHRLMDVINQEGSYAKLGFADFLKTLKNPQQIALASQTYGGLF